MVVQAPTKHHWESELQRCAICTGKRCCDMHERKKRIGYLAKTRSLFGAVNNV